MRIEGREVKKADIYATYDFICPSDHLAVAYIDSDGDKLVWCGECKSSYLTQECQYRYRE